MDYILIFVAIFIIIFSFIFGYVVGHTDGSIEAFNWCDDACEVLLGEKNPDDESDIEE